MCFAARNGMVGVRMAYQLAPANPWPGGPRDVAAAISWIRENIDLFGGNHQAIVVVGYSVGASHVASYLAHPELQVRRSWRCRSGSGVGHLPGGPGCECGRKGLFRRRREQVRSAIGISRHRSHRDADPARMVGDGYAASDRPGREAQGVSLQHAGALSAHKGAGEPRRPVIRLRARSLQWRSCRVRRSNWFGSSRRGGFREDFAGNPPGAERLLRPNGAATTSGVRQSVTCVTCRSRGWRRIVPPIGRALRTVREIKKADMKHSLTRKSASLALLLLGAAASNASAAPTTITGPAALALATVVAQHSSLPVYDKKIMARLFAGGSVFFISAKTKFSVAADNIVCRTSNVDIAARSCDLTFKVHKKALKGREANELYATAATAGVVARRGGRIEHRKPLEAQLHHQSKGSPAEGRRRRGVFVRDGQVATHGARRFQRTGDFLPIDVARRSRPPTRTGRRSDLNRRQRQHGGRYERSGWPVPLRCGAFRGDAQRRLQFDPPLHLLLLPNARRRRCHGGNGCDRGPAG